MCWSEYNHLSFGTVQYQSVAVEPRDNVLNFSICCFNDFIDIFSATENVGIVSETNVIKVAGSTWEVIDEHDELMNNNGPKKLPCGTPIPLSCNVESLFPQRTNCFLSDR